MAVAPGQNLKAVYGKKPSAQFDGEGQVSVTTANLCGITSR
jgi:hypothetical protein